MTEAGRLRSAAPTRVTQWAMRYGTLQTESVNQSPPNDGYTAIFGALPRELAYLRSWVGVERTLRDGSVRFWVGSHGFEKVLVVQTGMGPANSLQAVRIALSRFPVKRLISVGFACALRKEMRIGDLVLGERATFLDAGDRGLGPSGTYPADERLLKLAGAAAVESAGGDSGPRLEIHGGTILTVSRMIEKASEKKSIADSTGAIALDMESAAVGRAAAEARLAYLPIRAISDLVDEELGGVSHWVTGRGTLRPFKGSLYLLSHPAALLGLNRLRMHTAIASGRLGGFVHDYLHRFESAAI